MVKYSKFRDELKWYEDSDQMVREVSELLAGETDNFDEILEKMEQKFPNMNRVQELIGQASFVDRETRFYKSKGGSKASIAIYKPEGVKSSIIVAKRVSYGAMLGSTFFDIYPTTDVEKKLKTEILWSDQEWEQRE